MQLDQPEQLATREDRVLLVQWVLLDLLGLRGKPEQLGQQALQAQAVHLELLVHMEPLGHPEQLGLLVLLEFLVQLVQSATWVLQEALGSRVSQDRQDPLDQLAIVEAREPLELLGTQAILVKLAVLEIKAHRDNKDL